MDIRPRLPLPCASHCLLSDQQLEKWEWRWVLIYLHIFFFKKANDSSDDCRWVLRLHLGQDVSLILLSTRTAYLRSKKPGLNMTGRHSDQKTTQNSYNMNILSCFWLVRLFNCTFPCWKSEYNRMQHFSLAWVNLQKHIILDIPWCNSSLPLSILRGKCSCWSNWGQSRLLCDVQSDVHVYTTTLTIGIWNG